MRLRAVLAIAVMAATVSACGGDPPRASRPGATPTATSGRPRGDRLPRPPCRAGISNCASTSGRIVYVERVDPDGDGDLHVVVTDRHGVSLPGLTSIDVARKLRPRVDPRIGERAAAMGPVERGHLGQSQIQALVFRVRR